MRRYVCPNCGEVWLGVGPTVAGPGVVAGLVKCRTCGHVWQVARKGKRL